MKNMESGLKEINQNLLKLRRDIELIKNILASEGELSSWAKNELKEAREISDSENISVEALEKKIRAKK